MPVLEERHLHSLHDRPLHVDVRVAPEADFRIAAEVFVADAVAADPGVKAVYDDDLPVIAKVDLKAIHAAANRVKRAHVNASGLQPLHATAREIVAADFVVQQIDANAGLRALEKLLLKLPSDLMSRKM